MSEPNKDVCPDCGSALAPSRFVETDGPRITHELECEDCGQRVQLTIVRYPDGSHFGVWDAVSGLCEHDSCSLPARWGGERAGRSPVYTCYRHAFSFVPAMVHRGMWDLRLSDDA